jgi:histidine triad (HIT) family protein
MTTHTSHAAQGIVSHDPDCIFCKIVAGKIPSRKVYEDEDIFAFHDINPWAPVHFLLIPKLHIPSLAHVGSEHAALLGRMMALVPQLAAQEGCNPYPAGGFRVVANTGVEGGQEVHHLHWHLMGGPRPWARG